MDEPDIRGESAAVPPTPSPGAGANIPSIPVNAKNQQTGSKARAATKTIEQVSASLFLFLKAPRRS